MMGEMNFFLGLHVKQSNEGIFISQTKYTHEMVDKIGVKDIKQVKVPILSSGKIDSDIMAKPTNITHYRGIIGSSLYLTASRPDITSAIGICARYQANSKGSHMESAKKILGYVKGTVNLGLW